jgi:hemoglobin
MNGAQPQNLAEFYGRAQPFHTSGGKAERAARQPWAKLHSRYDHSSSNSNEGDMAMKFSRSPFRNTFAAFALLVMLAGGMMHSARSTPRVILQANAKSLYQRVGGYDALALVVDDFIGRLVSDKQFEKFFSGFSIDSKKHIRQHLLDQLCAATGGPCVYMGRDMKTTHGGLGITEADWELAVKHLTASIDKYKVGEKEKGELLALVSSLKKDIVEK